MKTTSKTCPIRKNFSRRENSVPITTLRRNRHRMANLSFSNRAWLYFVEVIEELEVVFLKIWLLGGRYYYFNGFSSICIMYYRIRQIYRMSADSFFFNYPIYRKGIVYSGAIEFLPPIFPPPTNRTNQANTVTLSIPPPPPTTG